MRIFKVLLFSFLLVSPLSLFAQSKPVYNVAILLENVRNKNIRHFTSDIKKGIKIIDKSANVNLKFISFKSASETLFKTYDAVMVISEDNTSLVSTGIESFVKTNKKKKNFLLVNFHSKKANPTSSIEGVDVLTSPSMERSAAPFLTGKVTKNLYDIIAN